MAERGVFHSRARAAQLLSFAGLQYGTITPTDFDMVIDFGGRAFVIGELKHGDAPLHRGQELALERAADAFERAKIPTLVLIASHSVDVGDVLVADAIVIRYRLRRAWHATTFRVTVREMIDQFRPFDEAKSA